MYFLFLERERKGLEREGSKEREERREREGKKEKHQFIVPPFMHSLVDSCMCPEGGWNLQLWLIGRTL